LAHLPRREKSQYRLIIPAEIRADKELSVLAEFGRELICIPSIRSRLGLEQGVKMAV
jgi:hypothetical protein